MKKVKFTLCLVLSFLLLGAGFNGAKAQFTGNYSVDSLRTDVGSNKRYVRFVGTQCRYQAVSFKNGVKKDSALFTANLKYKYKYDADTAVVTHRIVVELDYVNGKNLVPFLRRQFTLSGWGTSYPYGIELADTVYAKGDFTYESGTATYIYEFDMNALLAKYPNLSNVTYTLWADEEVIRDPNNANGEGNGVPVIHRLYNINLASGMSIDIPLTSYILSGKDLEFTVATIDSIKVTYEGDPYRVAILNSQLPISVTNGTAAGTWKVTIPGVRETIDIKVDYKTKTNAGENGNAVIAENAVWGFAGTLYVNAASASVLSVYNITGQLVRQETVSGNATLSLPKGIYIVKLNGKATKILL